jgi:putative SOS response-associated peptidase YedK
MCYSAQILQEYQAYTRLYGADIDVQAFVDLFWTRLENDRIKIPKALEAAFVQPQNESERRIKGFIDQYHAQQTTRLEQELFKQRKRLADAQRALLTKTTKAATEARRIATSKVEWALGKLTKLRRATLTDEDCRIFPGYYVPLIVLEHGRRVVKPMRYQCRPQGKPATYDTRYPGTYNARRDNLEGFWRKQFGHTHGVMVVNAFYEHVARPLAAQRGHADGGEVDKVILEFKPRPAQAMLAACVWSHWSAPGEPDLYSFAAITDDPPPEIAATGLDRCIIPIKLENLDAWLNPDPNNLRAQYQILNDRQRPYYENRLAA